MRWSSLHRPLSLGTAGALVASVLAGTAAAAPATTTPTFGTVYVLGTNSSGAVISEFSGTATGNPTPLRSIGGSATGLEADSPLAVGPTGIIYVVGTSGSGADIEEFAADANGNVAPSKTITGSKTGLTDVAGLAVAPNGDIWATNDGESSGSLLEFSASASGDAAPLATIAGSKTHMGQPYEVAVSPDGSDVWVSLVNAGSAAPVEEFATSSHGNVSPAATIGGAKTTLATDSYNVGGIAVDRAGDVWLTRVNFNAGGSESSTAILRFAAGSYGDEAPATSITGAKTDMSIGPDTFPAIALGAAGQLWIASPPEITPTGAALRYAASASGDAAPLTDITGAGHIENPAAIAVFASAPGAPRSLKAKAGAKKATLSWKVPATTGGAVTGYQVLRAARSSGPWTAAATTTRTTSTITGLKAGTKYFFRVEAFNDRGTSSSSGTATVKPS